MSSNDDIISFKEVSEIKEESREKDIKDLESGKVTSREINQRNAWFKGRVVGYSIRKK